MCVFAVVSSFLTFSKAVLKLLNIDMGQPRLPLPQINDHVLEPLRNDLQQIGFFDWAMPK